MLVNSANKHTSRVKRGPGFHEHCWVMIYQKLGQELAEAKHIQSRGQTKLENEKPQDAVHTKHLDFQKDGALVDQENHNMKKLATNQKEVHVLLVSGFFDAPC
jgi:hypothetical protein